MRSPMSLLFVHFYSGYYNYFIILLILLNHSYHINYKFMINILLLKIFLKRRKKLISGRSSRRLIHPLEGRGRDKQQRIDQFKIQMSVILSNTFMSLTNSFTIQCRCLSGRQPPKAGPPNACTRSSQGDTAWSKEGGVQRRHCCLLGLQGAAQSARACVVNWKADLRPPEASLRALLSALCSQPQHSHSKSSGAW